jgi:TRAP-type mannitol/chloroaromatic compound transport system substrate-binding protein
VLTNSKKPVTTLEDLKGLKIRVPKNEIMIATYQAWVTIAVVSSDRYRQGLAWFATVHAIAFKCS